ncbi:hypothetical protein CTAYLR_009267, partial [Chrysophaeum taylorii]
MLHFVVCAAAAAVETPSPSSVLQVRSFAFPTFESSLCSTWVCTSDSFVVTASGALVVSGSRASLQWPEQFTSTRVVRINGRVTKDERCDNHFVFVSREKMSFSFSTGALKIAWNCDELAVYGPTELRSTSCATLATYDFSVLFEAHKTTAIAKDDARICSVVLWEGLDDLDDDDDDQVWFYFGADASSTEATWLSLSATDSSATFAPTTAGPTASFVPTKFSTPRPTSPGNSFSFQKFGSSPCSSTYWTCSASDSFEAVDGVLVVLGDSAAIRRVVDVSSSREIRVRRWSEQFASTRVLRIAGTLKKDSSCNDHFVYVSVTPTTWAFATTAGVLRVVWNCDALFVYGPSSSSGASCSSRDTYDLSVVIEAFATTVTAISDSLACSVVLSEGLEDTAPFGQDLWCECFWQQQQQQQQHESKKKISRRFYFGADADSSSDAATWIALAATDFERTASTSSPTATPLPSVLPTPMPTHPERSFSFQNFESNPCTAGTSWSCTSDSFLVVADDGELVVWGDAAALGWSERFASTRVLRVAGTLRKDSSCNDHFVYVSVAPSTTFFYGTAAGTIRVAWSCSSLYVYGPSDLASTTCWEHGTYDLSIMIESDRTAVHASSESLSCSVTLGQGLEDAAPSGESLYFFFGADADDASDSATWLTLSASDSLATPGPTSTSPTATPRPSGVPTPRPTHVVKSFAFESFDANPCTGGFWSCTSDSFAVDPSKDGALVITGDAAALGWSERFSSARGLRITGTLVKDASCNDHFVYASVSPSTTFYYGTAAGTIRIAWSCNSLFIYGPSASTSTYCSSHGTYDLSILIELDSTRVAATTTTTTTTTEGLACSATLAQGLRDATAGEAEEFLYFFFGADADYSSDAATWLSLSATDTTATAPPSSARPTVTPHPTTPSPTPSDHSFEFGTFLSSPCTSGGSWSCSSSGSFVVESGALVVSGTGAVSLGWTTLFTSTRVLRIHGSLIKDESCDNHFVYLSVDPSSSSYYYWALSSTPRTIRVAWDCERLYVYGPSYSTYTSCSSYATYDLDILIESDRTAVSATFFDSLSCSVVLYEGLEDAAPGGEDLYFYFGADTSSTYHYYYYPTLYEEDGAATWLSLKATDSLTTDAPTTTTPTATPSPSADPTRMPTYEVRSFEFAKFDSSPCASTSWSCTSSDSFAVDPSSSGGALVISGYDAALWWSEQFASTRGLRITGALIKDASCNNHFVYVSTARTTYYYATTSGMIRIAWSCGYLYIYGPSSSTYTPCSSLGAYDLEILIESDTTSVAATTSSSDHCFATLAQGLRDVAARKEPLYFYFGAYYPDAATTWLSLRATDTLATAPPTSGGPTATPRPSAFPTPKPTHTEHSFAFHQFDSNPCTSGSWSCTSDSFAVTSRGALVVTGDSAALGWSERFTSTRILRITGSLIKDASCNNHFVYASVTPSAFYYGSTVGTMRFIWSCNALHVYGPSLSASSSCYSHGTYALSILIEAEITTVTATSGSLTCSVVLEQGLRDVAFSGEDLLFYFGADADYTSDSATWLSLTATDSATTESPTAIGPTVESTFRPTSWIPEHSFIFHRFDDDDDDDDSGSPCTSGSWSCTSGSYVVQSGALEVLGRGAALGWTDRFTSTRVLRIHGTLIKDESCDNHFVYVSVAPTSWSFSSTSRTIRVAWNCDSLTIYGPSTHSYTSCSSHATYDLNILIESEKTSVAADQGSTSCLVVLYEGLEDAAPLGENLLFYFGADTYISSSASTGATWLSLSATDSLATPGPTTAAPTATPLPTTSSTPRPTHVEKSLAFESFESSPCTTSASWSCTSGFFEVDSGELEITGGSATLRWAEKFTSTRVLRIHGTLIRDQSCDNHFVYASALPAATWSSATTPGTIRVAWACNNLYIFGPSMYTHASCSRYATYDLKILIEAHATSVEAISDSSFSCSVILSQGLEDAAPHGEDLSFYFGADADSADFLTKATWLSLRATDSLTTVAPTTAAPTATLRPTSWFSPNPTHTVHSFSLTAFDSGRSPYSAGALVLTGDSAALGWSERFTSTRVLRITGTLEKNSACNDHFVYASVLPTSWSFATTTGTGLEDVAPSGEDLLFYF